MIRALVIVMVLAGTARADDGPSSERFPTGLSIDTSVGGWVATADDPVKFGGAGTWGGVSAAAAMWSGGRVNLFGFVGHLAVGGTDDGGFVGDLGLSIGHGTRVLGTGTFGYTFGFGVSGVTGGRLGVGVPLPFALRLIVPAGPLRVHASAEAAWILREPTRQDGAPGLDENTFRLGASYGRDVGMHWGVSTMYRQLRDGYLVGVALTFGLVGVGPVE